MARFGRRVTTPTLLALAIGVGWSRVYLGVHWASDVVAGWLIAAAWLAIVVWLVGAAESIQQRLRGQRQLET